MAADRYIAQITGKGTNAVGEKSNTWLSKTERRLRKSFGHGDRSTWGGWLASQLNYLFMDHAILRTFWTNFYQLTPDVFRSNQPTHRRFRKYRDRHGIVAVLNLRGEENYPHFHLARESCDTLGLELHIAKLWARNAPKRERIQAVIAKLREMPRPLLFHCKSGADRAGFVAAMYLMIFEDAPLSQAREMLSMRFLHLKWTKTGVQDYILDVYEARQATGDIGFEDWIGTEYRAKVIQTGWDARQSPALIAADLQARATVPATVPA